jgi:hypothetical protein
MRTIAIATLGLLLLVSASGLYAAANPETGPTTILIPTLYLGPGAHGSNWWSGLVVNNYSSVPFSSPGVEFILQCPIPEGCFSAEVPPGELGVHMAPRPANGLLLHTTHEIARNLVFQARFGQGQDHFTNGTEMPVVREHQFTTRTIHLPSVVLHQTLSSIRTTLRIYGVDAIPGTTVRVEVRPWYAPVEPPLASKQITLQVPPSPTPEPIYPAYAQLNMQHEFPFEVLLGTSFNISIVPLPLPSGELPRIWAFISTTSNVNNDVSIQQPQ